MRGFFWEGARGGAKEWCTYRKPKHPSLASELAYILTRRFVIGSCHISPSLAIYNLPDVLSENGFQHLVLASRPCFSFFIVFYPFFFCVDALPLTHVESGGAALSQQFFFFFVTFKKKKSYRSCVLHFPYIRDFLPEMKWAFLKSHQERTTPPPNPHMISWANFRFVPSNFDKNTKIHPPFHESKIRSLADFFFTFQLQPPNRPPFFCFFVFQELRTSILGKASSTYTSDQKEIRIILIIIPLQPSANYPNRIHTASVVLVR